jgi:hypothetical protein
MGSNGIAFRVRSFPFKGKVGMGMGFKRIPNTLNYRIHLIRDLVIPKTQYLETGLRQKFVSFDVFARILVLAAVDLDNEQSLKAYEVEDEVFERMLSPEFVSAELGMTQPLPKQAFGIGHVAAQQTLQSVLQNEFV